MENKSHIQVLVKNNIVIAELIFVDNDPVLIAETFETFDYDQVIDTRKKQVSLAGLGALWNGKAFIPKPYPSWTVNDNLTWEAPKPKPEGNSYFWEESKQKWIYIDTSKEDELV
jgi:hypothetical protein